MLLFNLSDDLALPPSERFWSNSCNYVRLSVRKVHD